MTINFKNKFLYLFLIFLVFLLYFNSVKNNYSIDDHLVNQQNQLTQSGINGIDDIFRNYSFSEKKFTYAYRPVLLATFLIEYSVFGTNPHISHLISIILYALFVLLFFRFLQLLFPGESIILSLLTVILLIAHPINTEVVANIKSRDELLVGIFGILMLIQFFKFQKDTKYFRLFVIAVLFFLGYLTKQTILIYVAVIIVYTFISVIKKDIKFNKIILFILILFIAFICIRFFKKVFVPHESLSRNYLYHENPLINTGIIERIPSGFAIGMYYLKLLIWPFKLSFYYGYNQIGVRSYSDILPYISVFLHLGILYLAFKLFDKIKFLSVALIIYIVNIVAVSNIFILMPGIIGERFIFLGTTSFSMIFAYLLFKFFEKINWIKNKKIIDKKAIILISVIFLIFGVKVFLRNQEWRDSFTLISSDARHLTKSAKVQDLLSFQYMTKSKNEKNTDKRNLLINKAIIHCNKCIEIYPDYVSCWNNLGTIYFNKSDFKNAEKCYLSALNIDSTDANPAYNLGNIYNMQHKISQADKYYKKALISNPNQFDLIPVYKKFVIQNNLTDQAIIFVLDLLKKFPDNYTLHLIIIDFYNEKHDYNKMLEFLNKAYQIQPGPNLKDYIQKIKDII